MAKGVLTSMLRCVTSRSCRGITFHLSSSLRFAWNVSCVPAFPKTYMKASGYSVSRGTAHLAWAHAVFTVVWGVEEEEGSETHPVDP